MPKRVAAARPWLPAGHRLRLPGQPRLLSLRSHLLSPLLDALQVALSDRYAILEELGEGGMATVYLAEDRRHERRVAIKVLKPELSAMLGADRFLAEIKTTASLQHPHILPLFDSGEVEGHLYYVMPYVEGESLRDRLERETQLPVDEAVSLAAKVARALDAAHRAGVVHRDVKPGNILLSEAGEPLVADFGIALALESGAGARMTETGLSVGTPYYMAPEQATGDQQVGPVADVYSLACVLHELLVGEPPFGGSTAQAVLANVLTADPPRTAEVRRTVPAHVDAAIRKALAKLPADRFGSAVAFAEALGDPSFRYEAGGAPASSRSTSRLLLVVAVVAMVLGGGALAGLGLLRPDREAPHFQIPMRFAEDQALAGQGQFEISADGRVIVYQGVGREGMTQLWARRADEIRATPIAGTEGLRPRLVPDIAVSPDGEEVAFYRSGSMNVVPITGGTPRAVVDSVWGTARWSPDGEWMYLRRMGSPGISRVPADGGTPEIVTRPDTAAGESGHVWPDPLPGGSGVVFESRGAGGLRIKAADIETGEVVDLAAGRFPRYADGRLLFLSPDGATILSAPFDVDGLRLEGPPETLVDGLLGDASIVTFGFAVSRTGVLAYMPRRRWEPTWVTTNGAMRPVERGWYFDGGAVPGAFALSPEGGRLALRVGPPGRGNGDVWVKELDGGPMVQVMATGGDEAPLAWLDAETMAVLSSGETGVDAWTIRADGTGQADLLYDHDVGMVSASLSRDGRWLAFVTPITEYTAGGPIGSDIYAVDLGEGGEAREVLGTEDHVVGEVRLSPDARLVAHTTDVSGRAEVVIRPFPDLTSGRVQASAGGGSGPMWAPDGSGIYFVNGRREVVFAEVTDRLPLTVRRRTLFPLGPHLSAPEAVTASGEFLSRRSEPEIVLVIDWPQLLD